MKNLSFILLLVLASVHLHSQYGVSATGAVHTGKVYHRNAQGMGRPMITEDYFNRSLRTLAMQRNDISRMRIAQQMVYGNSLSTQQIIELMQYFQFEDSRIGLATHAYVCVNDPANYYMVASGFQHPQSLDELERRLGMELQHPHICDANCAHMGVMNQDPKPYGNYYTMMPMRGCDFDALVNSIQARSFDSSKLEIAKQAIRNNYMTSNQVRELMMLLTFESSKLELAKVAYRNVVDQENYFVTNDAFTFESSIRELHRYIYN